MKLKFTVTGMTCAACSARVEKVTKEIENVSAVEVNLLSGKMTVEATNEAVASQIIKAVENAGYGAALQGDKKQPQEENKQKNALKEMKIRIIGSFIFLAILMYFTMGHMAG